MAYDRARYRFVNFVGGRILQAREVNTLQDIAAGLDSGTHLATVLDLDAVYAEGALFNTQAVIAPSTKTVTLTAIEGGKPMYVFVRGRWEKLQALEAPAVTLPGGTVGTQVSLYLNWMLVKRTMADDAGLIDATTLEATAEMGELVLSVSATDTSGTALDSNTAFEKNTTPIVLFTFVHTSNSLTPVPKDNVLAQALATDETSGLVKTTTGSPIVVSTDDPRMTDGRAPTEGSVVDAKVRVPLQDGSAVNADGTPRYDLTKDVGGINSSKIIHQAGTQRLSDVLENVKTGLAAFDAELDAHEGAALGAGTTHPFPTAEQVGATPASHQALGPEAAHGLTAALNSGGYGVQRNKTVPANANDPAYRVFDVDGLIAALTHDGDVFSKKANSRVAPAVGSQPGGALGLLSVVAQVLAAHVGQLGVGPPANNNPHGMTIADIGYDPEEPPIIYIVDPEDWSGRIAAAAAAAKADAIAAANAYTDSKITGPLNVSFEMISTNILWGVINVGDGALAIGCGMVGDGHGVDIPSGFGECSVMASLAQIDLEYDQDNPAHLRFHADGTSVTAREWSAKKGQHHGNCSVVAVAVKRG